MSKLSKKLYNLTADHRAQLGPWADRWIANAMSTAPMDDADRATMRVAVRGLYEAAGLTPPPDHRIVFVPSPFVGRFSAGFAAAIWYLRKHGKQDPRAAATAAAYDATAAATAAATADATRDATAAATAAATRAATYDATRAATYDATRDATDAATAAATRAATAAATAAATRDATYDATRDATYDATAAATRDATAAATCDATRAATYDATRDATAAATRAATYDATYDATCDATAAATRDATGEDDDWYICQRRQLVALAATFGPSKFLLDCAYGAWRLWQGGNQWSGWTAYLSFFRHVAKLDLDYSKWQHYEAATIHAGPRWMHAEFCIISDRPAVLTVDAERRPHNDTGPFCRWRDGSALYAVHGVRVPWWLIEQPERLTAARILAEPNAEIRRVMMERFGFARLLKETQAERVDASDYGTLYRLPVADDEPLVMVEVENATPEPDGTNKMYTLRVPPTVTTAHEAVAWSFGMTPAEYAVAEAS